MSEEKSIPGIIKTGLKIKGGIGKIDKDAFKKHMPAGLTPESYDAHDGYRDVFVGQLASDLLDVVEKGTGTEEYAIAGVSLGGNTTVDIHAEPTGGLLIVRSTSHGENINLVLERSEAIYAAFGEDTADEKSEEAEEA